MVGKQTAKNVVAAVILTLSRILVAEYIIGFALWYGLATGLRDPSGTPLGADFLNVYAAGLMAHQGQSSFVYDWGVHGLTEKAVAGYDAPYFGWHYPPMFLALASVLAFLPYLWSFAIYMALSLGGYLAFIRRIMPKSREYIWALLAFPGVFANIINGQNGFVTTTLFGAGLMWLEEQPWLSGVMFGLLSYKPQFFIVIPLLLAVGGYGRALLATLTAASVSVLFSWTLFGTSTWQAFFASTKLTQHVVLEQGVTGWKKIQSVFSMARMWGADITTAYILQMIMAVIAIAATAWIWQNKKTTLATKAASLCACLLLTTPYLLDYDLVILAVPIVFLIRQGIETGFKPYEKPMLFALWLLPLLARNLGSYSFPLTPPLLVALLGMCLIRGLRSNRDAAPC